ncbi:MAG: LacI family DNA-binding transcriptional regulator [Bacillota bacterium]
MPTIKDIAKHANVSICTVSRYLNNNIVVKKQTEERILKAIDELGYVPNMVAQSLKRNRTQNVAVILPRINNMYYSEMTAGISQRLLQSHYNLFIFEVGNAERTEQEILMSMRENMVAGVIFMGQSQDYSFRESLHMLLDRGIPAVYMNRVVKPDGCPVIYPDFFRASELAAAHLVDTGKRRLALVHQLSDEALIARHRSRFSVPALAAGLDEPLLVYAEHGLSQSDACLNQLEAQEVDGVFVLNEILAARLTKALVRRGKRIPEQIGVIGLGNSVISSITVPELTGVDLKNHELGVRGAELMLAQIEGRPFEPLTVIEPSLLKRESTLMPSAVKVGC